MGSVTFTAPETMGFLSGSSLYGGMVNGYNNSAIGTGYGMPIWNAYVGTTIATPVTGLRLGLAWDYAKVDSEPFGAGSKLDAEVWSLAGYASFAVPDTKWSFHLRGEYLKGDVSEATGVPANFVPGGAAGSVLAPENGIFAVTTTVQYDLWKNVLSRVEFRWDHAEHGKMFGSSDSLGNPTAANAFLLAANIIYKF
jgi:hypothetical protein